MQEQIKASVHELELVIVDYRAWQPRRLNASVVTEIFVQDTNVNQRKSFNDVEMKNHEVLVEKRMIEVKKGEIAFMS